MRSAYYHYYFLRALPSRSSCFVLVVAGGGTATATEGRENPTKHLQSSKCSPEPLWGDKIYGKLVALVEMLL